MAIGIVDRFKARSPSPSPSPPPSHSPTPSPTPTLKRQRDHSDDDEAPKRVRLTCLSPTRSPQATEVKTVKKKEWNKEEYTAIETALRALRAEEASRGVSGLKGVRDIKLWTRISKELGQQGINRSYSACKNYWSRYGRVRSKFDERAIPIPGQLATSLQ